MVKKNRKQKEEEEILAQLDDELMQQFGSKIEKAINSVIKKNSDKDPRIELLTILMSFAAQVSQDLGIEEEAFSDLANTMYQEVSESDDKETYNEEEDLNIKNLN